MTTAAGSAALAAGEAARPVPARPVSTYSIVARDPATGNFGVAVQSHWFSVGATVPWAEAGVGAVATQSFVEVSYGPKGLAALKRGKSAPAALDALVKKDEQREVRQVAMVDAKGRVATWTGKSCIAAAGHRSGAGYSVQANMMDRDTVWGAMAKAYEAAAAEPFVERLLRALEAAQAEGGDVRGKQSAAILIVRAKSTGRPWEDRLVDLRVEDSEEPLVELRRLVTLERAYDAMNEGDEHLAHGDTAKALASYSEAAALAPQVTELPFWQAVTLFSVGDEARALPLFKEVFRRDPRWLKLIPRLPPVGLLPQDEEKIARILAQAP